MQSRSLSRDFRAPAKINWHLAVGGRRPDGYHDLCSLFETIDLCDSLTLAIKMDGGASGLSLHTPPGIPADERNTVAKADAALRRLLPQLPAIAVVLHKEIPHEAGLGGGSSDAACFLRAVNELLSLNLPLESLAQLALEVGSDVPYFLTGGRARVTGRGEIVETLPDAPRVELLVIMPDAKSSTAEAYRALHRPAGEFPMQDVPAGDPRSPEFMLACRNDFEAVMPPEILAPIARMKALGGDARLSGSGAASFGWFEGETALARAERELRNEFPFVHRVRTRPRAA